jgi:hypothetical protein
MFDLTDVSTNVLGFENEVSASFRYSSWLRTASCIQKVKSNFLVGFQESFASLLPQNADQHLCRQCGHPIWFPSQFNSDCCVTSLSIVW